MSAIVDRRKPEVAFKTKSHQAAETARVQQLQVSYQPRLVIYSRFILPEFTKLLKLLNLPVLMIYKMEANKQILFP